MIASQLKPASDPLASLRGLEEAYRNQWLLSTSEAQLLKVSPKTVRGYGEQFEDAGFVFTRAGTRKHRDHINYQHFKNLGLPLGSGMVESACKWLIQQRFKGVGMRWSEDGFNHLLHLRLAWVNGRFDKLFPQASPNR